MVCSEVPAARAAALWAVLGLRIAWICSSLSSRSFPVFLLGSLGGVSASGLSRVLQMGHGHEFHPVLWSFPAQLCGGTSPLEHSRGVSWMLPKSQERLFPYQTLGFVSSWAPVPAQSGGSWCLVQVEHWGNPGNVLGFSFELFKEPLSTP